MRCNDFAFTLSGVLILLSRILWTVATVLIGVEVIEVEDLPMIGHLRNAVGNLDYGDKCRNNAIEDITSDVCFKSNPYFQCVDGVCRCAYVRIPGEYSDTHEQMKYFQGKCRGLENFACSSDDNCGEGLECSGTRRMSVREDASGTGGGGRNGVESDFVAGKDALPPTSSKIKVRNIRQRILKEKIKKLYKVTAKESIRELEGGGMGLTGNSESKDVSNDLIEGSDGRSAKSGEPEGSLGQKTWNQVKICVKSDSRKLQVYTRSDKLRLIILTTLFHSSGWRFCMKS